MAALITHIVLSDKIFDKHFQDKEKKDFFIGTSLPDIRYLEATARDKTHFENLILDEIKKENSFFAGLKFHSFLDITRERFIVSKNIYSLYPKFKYLKRSLKLLEDDILYNKINNWDKFISFFNEPIEEELSLGIQERNISKWHKRLQRYFFQQPNENTRNTLLTDAGLSKGAAKEMNENIKRMRNNQETIQVINALYDNFESILIDSEKSDKFL